jgi:hypothetical protein
MDTDALDHVLSSLFFSMCPGIFASHFVFTSNALVELIFYIKFGQNGLKNGLPF